MANGSSYHTLVIGAGAAGLMATIFAARSASPGSRIAALDGATHIGAKILVSGGGRCNVTHDVVTPDDYAGSKRNQIAKVLRTFPVEDTIRFFDDLGVPLKREDTGKLFPVSDSARTVLEALLSAAEEAGTEVMPDHRVNSVTHDGEGFWVTTNQGELRTCKLILATGGKSLPKTGSDGLGFALAGSLGHTATPTHPALVPLVLEQTHWLVSLSGLAAQIELSVASGTGKNLHRQRGAVLMTHFGLSGPAAMDISRHWIAERNNDPNVKLLANFLPDKTFEQAEQELVTKAQSKGPTSVLASINQALPKRLAQALIQAGTGIDPATPIARLSKPDRRALLHSLTALDLPVVRDRGYLFAEATAGGVPLSELDLSTMASRNCPGLYLCGEILDVDGRIGGYNFQWAWCSGRLAGISAGRQD